MKKIKRLIAVVLIGFVFGCASVSFNPETGEVNYSRWGDQKLEGLSIIKTEKGYDIKLNSQQSDAEAMLELIQMLKALGALQAL